ncbi:hypothetical protein J6590_046643, partial [Homalodisca vitripennis]
MILSVRMKLAKTDTPEAFHHCQPPTDPTIDRTDFYPGSYQKPAGRKFRLVHYEQSLLPPSKSGSRRLRLP